METIIIYDDLGKVFSVISGDVLIPQGGVQYLAVDIPEGKQIKFTDGIGVDVSVTPHQVILEDRPPTIEDKLAEKEVQIIDLKKMQVVTNELIVENSAAQQDLLELLTELGVI